MFTRVWCSPKGKMTSITMILRCSLHFLIGIFTWGQNCTCLLESFQEGQDRHRGRLPCHAMPCWLIDMFTFWYVLMYRCSHFDMFAGGHPEMLTLGQPPPHWQGRHTSCSICRERRTFNNHPLFTLYYKAPSTTSLNAHWNLHYQTLISTKIPRFAHTYK